MSCISVTICLTGMERWRNKSQVENIRQAHVISRIAVPMFRLRRCAAAGTQLAQGVYNGHVQIFQRDGVIGVINTPQPQLSLALGIFPGGVPAGRQPLPLPSG